MSIVPRNFGSDAEVQGTQDGARGRAEAVTPVLPRNSESGRGDWIRTSDPLRPRQVRYQAALRPDCSCGKRAKVIAPEEFSTETWKLILVPVSQSASVRTDGKHDTNVCRDTQTTATSLLCQAR